MSTKSITLKDNNESDRVLSDDEAKKLLRFSGCSLKKLCTDNPSFLLFPECFGDNGDDTDEPLYSIVGGKICVGNVVGFWGVDGVNVRVHSRFDDDKHQYFFHYMLQRIVGINVIDLETLPDSENIWDFLIYLFPMMLKRAVRQGIFRAYRVFRYNDDRVKGAIDIPRFIRRDIPFAGKIAYATREHAANNHVLQLVRHTIEFVRRTAPVLLSVDLEMRQAVDAVMQVTPDYADRSLGRVIASNLRPVRHPFYSAYTELQKLCLRILRHEKISFGESDGTICGIVFDAAWLWEEYLATLLNEQRWKIQGGNSNFYLSHPRNREQRSSERIYLVKSDTGRKRGVSLPDFMLRESRDADVQDEYAIFDAKYKRLMSKDGRLSCVQRDDRLQMISYLHVTKSRYGLFLFPKTQKEKILVSEDDEASESEKLNVQALRYGTVYGYEWPPNTNIHPEIWVVPFVVPEYDGSVEYPSFMERMGVSEEQFVSELKKVLNDRSATVEGDSQ